MTLRRFERIATLDDVLNRVQERLEDSLAPVMDASIIDGQLITGQELVSGTTSIINHKLGRNIRGWIVVAKNAAQHVYDVQSSNDDPDKFLYLTAGGTVTVDLWVF
tara:strand:+ start:2469 stop:2786 length:318 start_codon:yes stop_codon:yes gene_type:complete